MGDSMTNRPGDSFHAVVFGGVNDLFDKKPGEATARDALLGIAIANATKDMRATLQFFLNVPDTNIQVKSGGTYAELGAMITNAWRHMNDNEQFILFVADHGSRHCQKTNLAPCAGGNGFCVTFMTEPYLESSSIERPVVAVKTAFVGPAGGEARFNGHRIGILPPTFGPVRHEFFFDPNLIKPVGQNNLVQIIAPNSNVGVTMVDLSTGPVLGGDFSFGAEPFASLMNVRNATGESKTGFQIVYEGRLSANAATRAQRTMADGTPIADWGIGGPTISYDSANGFTSFDWEDPNNPITNGAYASFRVVAPSRSLRPLRYSWMPPSPDPSMELAPVNLKSAESVTSSNITLSIFAAPLITSTQELRVSVRVADSPILASQFYFHDPALTSLPGSSTQTVVLAPEARESLTFPLPPQSPVAPLPTTIVESLEQWRDGLRQNSLLRVNQIHTPPAFDTTCVTNCPGSGAVFTVNVAGGMFRWYKDGQLVTGQTSGTLTLLNLTKDDEAIYTGVGTNATEVKRKFFKLFIEDKVPPTVNCPADITVKAAGPNGALVNYGGGISASDPCGRIDGGTFQCNPPPGLFPIGTTEVACRVADTFGNVGRCTFNVTVLPPGKDLTISPNVWYSVLWWADATAALQYAPSATGPWETRPEATSPYTVTHSEMEWFFRLRFR